MNYKYKIKDMYKISTCISQISITETYHVMHWVEINSVDCVIHLVNNWRLTSVDKNVKYFLQGCTVHEKKNLQQYNTYHLQITSLPSLTVPSSVKRTFPAEIKGKIYMRRQLILFYLHNIMPLYRKFTINLV